MGVRLSVKEFVEDGLDSGTFNPDDLHVPVVFFKLVEIIPCLVKVLLFFDASQSDGYMVEVVDLVELIDRHLK